MMNKLDYLREMENILKVRLSKKEVDEIMRDYAEYFVEGARQGKTDFEIAYNLGDPREVANQIIIETLGSRQAGYEGDAPRPRKTPIWRRAVNGVQSAVDGMGKAGGCLVRFLLLLIGLCLLPFALMAALMVLGMVGMVLVGLFGGVALLAGGLLLAVCLLLGVCLCVGSLPFPMVLLGVLLCVGGMAGCILGICLLLLFIRFIWSGLVWCWRRVYRAVTKRPAPVYRPGEWREPDPTAPLRKRAASRAAAQEMECDADAPSHQEEQEVWYRAEPEDQQPKPEEAPFEVNIPEEAFSAPVLEEAPNVPQDGEQEDESRLRRPAEEYDVEEEPAGLEPETEEPADREEEAPNA